MTFSFTLLLVAVHGLVFVQISPVACAYDGIPWDRGYPPDQKVPLDVMVDVVNKFAISLLMVHNENNHDDNIALSPYGATSVLVALAEGLVGEAASEIGHTLNLPSDISVMRVGFRDILRHLKSYFIPKEGFLAGLTLSHDNITLSKEYEDILNFYGYDVDNFNNPLYPSDSTVLPPTNSTITTGGSEGREATEPVKTPAIPPKPVTKPEIPTKVPPTSTTNATVPATKVPTTPQTTLPATNLPSTIPSTNVPKSDSPPTVIPPVPVTSPVVTPTSSDPSSVPPSVPPTNVPATPTDVPATPTDVPATPTDVPVPPAETPPAAAPPAEAPPAAAPPAEAPPPEAPPAAAPPPEAPPAEAPPPEAPPAEAPPPEAPPVEAPPPEAPPAEAPPPEAPPAEAPPAEAPPADAPPPERRRKRSLIDYEIAKYYDNYYINSNNRRSYDEPIFNRRNYDEPINTNRRSYDEPRYIDNEYIPEEPYTFLIDGVYRESNVDFMTYDTVLPFTYIPGLDAMALSFPLDSDEYYLLLVLPINELGINTLIDDFKKYASLSSIVNNLKYSHVKAVIPSFELKGNAVLTHALQKLCIKRIFEPRRADFSKMTSQKDIYVTNIEQSVTVNIKNYMDPDKMYEGDMGSYRPVIFRADHPFLYFVMDTETNVNLMAGKIINPLNTRVG